VTNEKPINPRLNEDLRFEAKPGGPLRYNSTTDKPVQYITVADLTGTAIGYVWANDEDDAASWLDRKDISPASYNEGMLWTLWLRDAKARGIAPSEALAELMRVSTVDGANSRVVPGSLTEIPDVEILRALAREN
jgi:hypothetical protein